MIKNNNSLITLLLFFFSINFLMAQTNFEGKIKIKISDDGHEMFLDYFIKGNDIRMEMGENKEAVFIKNSKQSLLLMLDQKMYMDLDNSIFSKISGMNKNNAKENEFDYTKSRTGKTMTILGYKCDQWIFNEEEEENQVEAWVTGELGNFMFIESPMGEGFSPGWSSSVKNNGFFPLLVITRDTNGVETSRFEATEIIKQNLDDNLFSPPSDFTEMKIPGM